MILVRLLFNVAVSIGLVVGTTYVAKSLSTVDSDAAGLILVMGLFVSGMLHQSMTDWCWRSMRGGKQ